MVYSRSRDLTDLLRNSDPETLQREIILRYLGVDHLSRDDDVRRAAILAAVGHGGYGSRDDSILEDLIRADEIRRTNVYAQIANGHVRICDLNAEVHPKMNSRGQYMKAFDLPKRLEQLLGMDRDVLDRLLRFYDLAPDVSRRLNLTSSLLRNNNNNSFLSSLTSNWSESDHDARMSCLLEFLGVDVSDVGLELRRDRYLSTAGLLASSNPLFNGTTSLLNHNSSLLNGTSNLLRNGGLLSGTSSLLNGTNSLLPRNNNSSSFLNASRSLLEPSSNPNSFLNNTSSLLNGTSSLLNASRNLLRPSSTSSLLTGTSSLLNPSRDHLRRSGTSSFLNESSLLNATNDLLNPSINSNSFLNNTSNLLTG